MSSENESHKAPKASNADQGASAIPSNEDSSNQSSDNSISRSASSTAAKHEKAPGKEANSFDDFHQGVQ